MVKRAYFYIVCFFLALGAGFGNAANAQDSTEIPEDYDPLEERMKLEGAYIPNYRELMRDLIAALGHFAKENRPGFQVVLDGGQTLLTRGEWENDLDDLHRAEMAGAKTDDEKFLLKLFSPEHPVEAGTPNRRLIQTINGILTTNQVCGGAKGKLPEKIKNIIKEHGLFIIDVEHCADEKEKNAALAKLAKEKIPAHADTDKKGHLDQLNPDRIPFLENPENIDSVLKVRNILMMTNTRGFTDKDIWLETLENTNYDMLIIEPFFKSSVPLTKDEVKRLKSKKIGTGRLVYAVLNVAVAEDTRLYWEKGWKLREPAWLRFPSKTNPAGIIADYWNPAWKRIVGIYFKSIMDLGFDGVVLQGVDEHKTYERIIPIS